MKQHWNKIDYEVKQDINEPHEANLLKLDCSKAHTVLKWKNVWESNTTFKKTVNWYKSYYEENNILTFDDLESYIFDAKRKNIEWTQ